MNGEIVDETTTTIPVALLVVRHFTLV